ncbi:MAG: dihydropteroate synthase [Candidatus Methylacidiphilales bacterium]|nr:dihydropteroate synthase [Candidatus Methylacidiphilales bacterium]
MIWKHASGRFDIGSRPLLMGVLNVTPDSFSDGGCFLETSAAVDHGLRLLDDGADLIDIGGESTRPGAEPVPAAEEIQRVLPVIRELARLRPAAVLSVDTYKAAVAKEALQAGASVVNDVGAGLWDPEMLGVVAGGGAGYIAMHSRGTPRTMQADPHYANVTADVMEFLSSRRRALDEAGIPAERVAFDPGVGFGKTVSHNLELITQAAAFKALGRPVVWGLSRKSFIFKSLGLTPEDSRLPGGLAAHARLISAGGPQIWRVHEVAETRQFVHMWELLHNDAARRTG